MEFETEIVALLEKSCLVSKKEADSYPKYLQFKRLDPDGSNRKFSRIMRLGEPLCLAVAPASNGEQDSNEAYSSWLIGKHLEQKNIPVPKMYGWDRETGLIICEDLGDTKLFDRVKNEAGAPVEPFSDELRSMYRQAVEILAVMQIRGGDNFDTSWCWDTERYDQELRFTRESQYYLESFWRDMLGCEISPELIEECRELARLAGGGRDYFLHRDFQSRNIMIKDGQIRIIDFQGGRLGPLGYDLASLLIDPYTALPDTFQDELMTYYTTLVGKKYACDISSFPLQYSYLALQRNLQILGAFSFLYRVRNKVFFSQFISPSLHMLQRRLGQATFKHFTALKESVDRAVLLYRVKE